MSAKIKISLEDPETREIWNTVLAARREVASWPAWKRGEWDTEIVEASTPDAPAATAGATATDETKK